MGTKELRNRSIWQDVSGENAGIAEKTFYEIFTKEFEGTKYQIRSKPREFKDIYSKVALSEDTLSQIYNPDETWVHGVIPDFAIDNTETKKTLYVEVKRQDGWVEGKPRKAGRGNAHERSNKFFTPGLMKMLREKGGLGENVIPFWAVFQGDIARDPKRNREIHFWYGEHSNHFFLWWNSKEEQPIIKHFNEKLKHLLD
jgi:hypothetical protein